MVEEEEESPREVSVDRNIGPHRRAKSIDRRTHARSIAARDVQRIMMGGASMIPSFRYFQEIWWGNTRHVDAVRFFEVIENNWIKRMKKLRLGFSFSRHCSLDLISFNLIIM